MNEIKEAIDQFYAALNVMCRGDMAPMDEIWSHADDVTYLDPSGSLLVGWGQVRGSWEAQSKICIS